LKLYSLHNFTFSFGIMLCFSTMTSAGHGFQRSQSDRTSKNPSNWWDVYLSLL